jgi:hypothetical protein
MHFSTFRPAPAGVGEPSAELEALPVAREAESISAL